MVVQDIRPWRGHGQLSSLLSLDRSQVFALLPFVWFILLFTTVLLFFNLFLSVFDLKTFLVLFLSVSHVKTFLVLFLTIFLFLISLAGIQAKLFITANHEIALLYICIIACL